MPRISPQHQKFLERLDRSSDAVFAVARWLHDKGEWVEIPPVRRAPTAAEANEFVDSCDLIARGAEGTPRIIEVKRISRLFNGRHDWPFREVFISNVAAVDRRATPPVAYITLSDNLRAAAVVRSTSRERWYVTETLASNTGNVERFYACRLEDALFITLGPHEAEAAA